MTLLVFTAQLGFQTSPQSYYCQQIYSLHPLSLIMKWRYSIFDVYYIVSNAYAEHLSECEPTFCTLSNCSSSHINCEFNPLGCFSYIYQQLDWSQVLKSSCQTLFFLLFLTIRRTWKINYSFTKLIIVFVHISGLSKLV